MNHEKLGKILQVITKQGSHFLLGTDQYNNSCVITFEISHRVLDYSETPKPGAR